MVDGKPSNLSMTPGETPVRERVKPWAELPAVKGLESTATSNAVVGESQTHRRLVFRVGMIAAGLVFVFSVISHTEQAPELALVLRDEVTKQYLSPSCGLLRRELRVTTLGDARRAGLRPEPACERSGGFLGASQTVLQETLALVHLYPVRGSRWRPDGTWKW